MKTFNDLEFKPHGYIDGVINAVMTFEDGSEISVLKQTKDEVDANLCCSQVSFEMMSNRSNKSGGVRGWLSKDQITRHMRYIQNNPKT